MWTRGKDKTQPGAFAYELWEGSHMVERVGGFATAQDADRAGERAQRRLSFPSPPVLDPIPDDLASLSDDELMAALSE